MDAFATSARLGASARRRDARCHCHAAGTAGSRCPRIPSPPLRDGAGDGGRNDGQRRDLPQCSRNDGGRGDARARGAVRGSAGVRDGGGNDHLDAPPPAYLEKFLRNGRGDGVSCRPALLPASPAATSTKGGAMSSATQERMKRVVVDHFGGPEVLRVVEDDAPRPGPGEVRVRVLAAGVSFTDSQLRAGTYLGVPKPPFTPGYELVGVVEELGPGCSRLRVGDRVGALTEWGADAERVCVPEAYAVEVPEDLDPAEVVSLVFTYMTAYQLLHRAAMAKSGETVLVHGAAGRVGTAVLELGALAGLRLYGTASARDRAAVERLGAVAIDYRNEDFLARVRELTGDGVDVVLDSLGGPLSLRSFRALRPGGRLVVFGYSSALTQGRRIR